MVRWYSWPADTEALEGTSVAPPSSVGEAAIEDAARAVTEGSILVHPTSTVYGLGGLPDPSIDARLAGLKGRESGPLIALVADREALFGAFPALVWTATAERLADVFWPGPLTLVLEQRDGSSRAVRVDGHPVVQAVLERVGGVMTSTSLNVSGCEPARSRRGALLAIAELSGPLDHFGWLDVGDLPESEPSTLVRASDGRLEVLREGAIRRTTLERSL